MKKFLLAGLSIVAVFIGLPILAGLAIVTMSSQAAAECRTQQATGSGFTTPASNVQAELMRLRFADGYPTMTAEQARNAIIIAQVARELRVPRYGLQIAIATAIQESHLINLEGGDRDSAGLFQQRPSAGWGSRDQVTTPRLAAQAFFGRADHTHNPGLLDIPGWERLPLTVAAQRVQNSGDPEAYAQWETVAGHITDLLGGHLPDVGSAVPAGEDCRPETDLVAGGCPSTGSPAEKGLTPDALLVLRSVDAQFGSHTYLGVGERSNSPDSDHPSGRAVDVMIESWQTPAGIAHGTRIAEWLRAHARELGVSYLIWRGQIWSTGDKGWRSYRHPSGDSDPTLAHMDHVHVSVYGTQGTAECGGATGQVVYPVLANLAESDARNWRASSGSWSAWHTGTDFSVACGTPVFASHAGTVEIDTTEGWAGPWLVKVTTGADSLTTWYAHMRKVTVSRGQTVTAGQQIGEVGDEGNSEGCHLHFEVHQRNGSIYGSDNVDPSKWLAEHTRRLGDRQRRRRCLGIRGGASGHAA